MFVGIQTSGGEAVNLIMSVDEIISMNNHRQTVSAQRAFLVIAIGYQF